eukprot:472399_1
MQKMPPNSKTPSIIDNVTISSFKHSALSLVSGFSSGLIVAFALNPYDKALYLSVIHQRSFLNISNFHQPFQGVTQTLFQRAVSNGLYFPFEHFAYSISSNTLQLGPTASSITAGTFAGAMNALLLNPIAAVKYTSWNNKQNISYINQLYVMYNKGGKQQFIKGMYATMTRDIIFGSIFAYLRHSRRKQRLFNDNISYKNNLWIDASSAFVATMLSSPFNFVRNIQYATEHNQTHIPSMMCVLRNFYLDGLKENSVMNRMKYWLFRLRIGWGTARVAVGMSFTSFCYEYTQRYLVK